MIISEITNQDLWYPKLYQKCFDKKDVWFNNLNSPRFKAYHIEKKAFLIVHKIDDKEFEIITIGVDPKHRRVGLAKYLLNHLIRKLATGSKIFLEVSTDNLSAVNLYKSLGFKEVSLRKNYYQNNDATIMCFTTI